MAGDTPGRPALRPGELGKITTTKLATGSWQAFGRVGVRTGGTKRLKRTSSTEAEAIAGWGKAASGRSYVGLKWSHATPVAQCIDTQLSRTESRVERGIITHQSAERDRWNAEIIRSEIGSLAVRDVSAGLLTDMLNVLGQDGRLMDAHVGRRSGDGYSVSVVNRIRALLIEIFDVAVNRDCIHTNPALRLQRREQARRVLPALTPGQSMVVLRVAAEWERRVAQRRTPLRAFIALGLATSLRRGELLALRACDVEYHPEMTTMGRASMATVTVNGTIIEVKDTGRWRTFRQPFTKAKKHRRLWVPEFGVNAIHDLLRGATALDPERPLFSSRSGGWITNQTLRRAWNSMVDEGRDVLLDAGIDLTARHFTPHTLRRTALTALGADDAQLAAEQAGHDDARTTHAHYIAEYRLPTVDPRAAQVLQERIGGALRLDR